MQSYKGIRLFPRILVVIAEVICDQQQLLRQIAGTLTQLSHQQKNPHHLDGDFPLITIKLITMKKLLIYIINMYF